MNPKKILLIPFNSIDKKVLEKIGDYLGKTFIKGKDFCHNCQGKLKR